MTDGETIAFLNEHEARPEEYEAFASARSALVDNLEKLFADFQKVPYMDHSDLMAAVKDARDRVVFLPA